MGVFYPEKSQQNWLFPVCNRKFQEFQKSGLNETCVCGWNLSEYTIMEQQAGCNRRVQEVVRVKQRKKKIRIESFSNGLNHRGSICGVRFGSDLFGGVALRASVWILWHLIGVWVRGFLILRSRRWFFSCGWPPVVFFFIETTTAFFFRLLFASIIKNRPARGGFFLQLDLCGPNSKLCRWYRTFFEILLRISAFFALVRCKFPSEFGTLHREHGKMHSVEVVKGCETRFRERFLATACGRRAKVLKKTWCCWSFCECE